MDGALEAIERLQEHGFDENGNLFDSLRILRNELLERIDVQSRDVELDDDYLIIKTFVKLF